MKLTHISRCVCSIYDSDDSIYCGMPQLKVTADMQFFEVFCPKCGRGGLSQFKSAYLALKFWNELQSECYSIFLYELESKKQDI